jgi:uncharacterized membrane-anchored protein YitT (DUF2179 family)
MNAEMSFIQKALAVFIGSVLLAIGVNFFLVPFELLDGGMIGIGLILNYLLGFKAGFIIILLSVPIFILAWFHNRNYFFNSLHGMLFSSFVIDLLFPYHTQFTEYIKLPAIASSIVGGLLVGLGIGVMLRFETSTGGTDLVAQFLSHYFKLNVGLMIFLIDLTVIGFGGLLLSGETFLLSAITICFVGLATSICTLRIQRI